MPEIPNLFVSDLGEDLKEMTIFNGNLYVVINNNFVDGSIKQINLSTKEDLTYASGLAQVNGIISDTSGNIIYTYLNNIKNSNELLNSSIQYPGSLAISGDYLYVNNTATGTISKLYLSNLTSCIDNFITNQNSYHGEICIDTANNYLYFSNDYASINQYYLSNGIISTENWYFQSTGIKSMVIYNNYMYAAVSTNLSICRINLSNTDQNEPSYFSTNSDNPYGLALDGSKLYVSTNQGNIYKFQLPIPIPIPPKKDNGIKCSTRNGPGVSPFHLQTKCVGQKVPGTSLIYYTCSNTSCIVDQYGLLRNNN